MDNYERIRSAIGKVVDSGTHFTFAGASQKIARKLGLSENMVQFTHIELRNTVYEPDYKSIPYNERVLFLPHCSRNAKECKADFGEEGYECKKCGGCELGEAIKIAEELGYKKVFIVPGGTMLKKLIKKYKPKATVGVCCFNEALLAFDTLKGTGIVPQVVLLLRDGCVNTKMNLPLIEEKLELIDEDLINEENKK